jgi:lipoprotein signal peptidase
MAMRRFVVTAVALATADLSAKTLAHGAGLLEPVRNPGLALGVVDVGTAAELGVMLIGLFGGGIWLLHRAAAGKGRLTTAVLIMAGAASNLADRLVFGSVRDFIPTPWAVFNLADVFLAAGVVFIYSDLWRERRRPVAALGEIGKVHSAQHRRDVEPYARVVRPYPWVPGGIGGASAGGVVGDIGEIR